jgi:hypothetical protein
VFARIAIVAVVVVLLGFAWLAQPAYERVSETRRLALDTRAKLVAEDLARDLTRAAEIGLAIDQLRGIDDVLAAQIRGRADFSGVRVTGPKGQLMAAFPTTFDSVNARSVTAEVRARSSTVARVVVYYHDQTAQLVLLEIGALLIGLALIGIVPALVTLRQAMRLGPEKRDEVLGVAYSAIARGQLDKVYTTDASRGHDMRLVWLARHVRALHEAVARLERVVTSLIATEPAPARREALYSIRREARGANLFAKGALLTEHVQQESRRASWALFLAPAGLCSMLFPLSMAPVFDFAVLFAAMALGLVTSRLLFDPSVRDFGCSLFAAAIGVTAAVLPEHQQHISSALAGVAIGLLTSVLLELEYDNVGFWVSGIALGLGIGFVFQPLGNYLPRVLGLTVLAAAFWLRGWPARVVTEPILARQAIGWSGLRAAAYGIAFSLLLTASPIQSGVFSGALLAMISALGLAAGVWLSKPKVFRILVLLPAITIAIVASQVTIYVAPLLTISYFLVAVVVGCSVRSAIHTVSDITALLLGAAAAALVIWMVGYNALIATITIGLVLTATIWSEGRG